MALQNSVFNVGPTIPTSALLPPSATQGVSAFPSNLDVNAPPSFNAAASSVSATASSINVAAIVIGVVVPTVVIGIIIFLIYYFLRRRKMRQANYSGNAKHAGHRLVDVAYDENGYPQPRDRNGYVGLKENSSYTMGDGPELHSASQPPAELPMSLYTPAVELAHNHA